MEYKFDIGEMEETIDSVKLRGIEFPLVKVSRHADGRCVRGRYTLDLDGHDIHIHLNVFPGSTGGEVEVSVPKRHEALFEQKMEV